MSRVSKGMDDMDIQFNYEYREEDLSVFPLFDLARFVLDRKSVV